MACDICGGSHIPGDCENQGSDLLGFLRSFREGSFVEQAEPDTPGDVPADALDLAPHPDDLAMGEPPEEPEAGAGWAEDSGEWTGNGWQVPASGHGWGDGHAGVALPTATKEAAAYTPPGSWAWSPAEPALVTDERPHHALGARRLRMHRAK
ncbi:MAG: hypothetical protein ACRDWW_08690 [Acidimicrobiales bacterium]